MNLDNILPSIKVIPFPVIVDAPGKYHKVKQAVVECPTCLALGDFYSLEKRTTFDIMHCAGNQPPEVECHNPLSGSKHMHQVVCAGVVEPHFHVCCQCCGSRFLLGIPEKK